MQLQLLFECLSEEIPPRMQNSAAIQVENYIVNAFNKKNIKFTSIKVFVTARRITLYVKNINISKLKSFNSEIKGPNINASKDAIKSFLKKNEKNEIDLFVRKLNNKNFYFVKNNICSFNIQKYIKNLLEEMLKNFSWPKSMRWNERREKWIRPIQNILCILNNEIIPISFAGITAHNITYGHRFFSNNIALTVKTPKDYFILLKYNKVILQANKRKQLILDQINKFIKEYKLQFEKNDYLLNELVGFVEWPIVLFGKVNQEKLSELPKEIILSIINKQQKCLVLSKEQKISHFITVVNVNNNKVVEGYEKILKARLTDALFLITQDKKKNLDYFVKKLDLILFHTSLGNIGKKVKRIITLSKYIAMYIPYTSLIKVERAAYLAKADLSTSIIKEFPELQGTIGGYYASYFQEDKEIIEAIADHYKPIGPEQDCPKSPTTISVAIADKIDSLIGLIIAGEKFSGSYDQFGLRRTAISIIRIILENNLHIPIKLLINKSISLYPKSLFTKRITTSSFDGSNRLTNKKKILELVLNFFLKKFRIILKNKGIRQNTINSILQTNINDLLIAKNLIIALDQYLNKSEGKQILGTYKRINNIVTKAEKNDIIAYDISYNKELLISNEEIALSKYSIVIFKKIKQLLKNNCFDTAFDELANFTSFINQFMDNVKINCDSNELRKNRLSLLKKTTSIFHLIAHFNLLIK